MNSCNPIISSLPTFFMCRKVISREKVLGVKSNLCLNIELKFEKWKQTDNDYYKKEATGIH